MTTRGDDQCLFVTCLSGLQPQLISSSVRHHMHEHGYQIDLA